MISLAGLNSSQRLAAETIEGPVLILAGAGSGKTRTLTYRIANMIGNLGISPKSVLAVSFTNKAAKEMKERVSALLPRKKMSGITLSTFHSLGVKILKNEIHHLGYGKNFSIYDTSDQLAIVRDALKKFDADKAFDKKTILSKIGFLKNKAISAEDFGDSAYFDPEDPYDIACEHVYREYSEKLLFYNAIDFDDILFLTVKLFNQNPEIVQKYSTKFKYIMVDEYQDTNPIQFDLITHLTHTHSNLCVVGDDDQSIYGFRGADIANILSFENQFENAKVIKLEQNYRSCSKIIGLANTVIKENKNRKDKTMKASFDGPHHPTLWACGDTEHEAEVIVDEIVGLQSAGKHLADIAILFRSNTQIPPLEDQLRISMIPYTVIGGQKFYDKKEVKDLIAYLSVIHNSKDELSLRRILNVPHRGVGLKTLNLLVEEAKKTDRPLFETIGSDVEIKNEKTKQGLNAFKGLIQKYRQVFENRPLAESIQLLTEEISYDQFIEKSHDNPKQVTRRKEDIRRFVERAANFERLFGQNSSLSTFLEKILLADNQDSLDESDDDDIRKNEVQLLTLHSSKGLEFDTVFLLGMEEELLPHKRTISEGQGVDEERRLAYVGVTRAKEKLIMTYAKKRKIHGREIPRFPSRFILGEAEKLITKNDRTTLDHLNEDEKEEYKNQKFDEMFKFLDC